MMSFQFNISNKGFLLLCIVSVITSFTFKFNHNSIFNPRLQSPTSSIILLATNSNSKLDAITTDKTTYSSSLSSSSSPQLIKNLKKSPGNLPDDTFLNSWKELQGLSEKELLTLKLPNNVAVSASNLLPLSKVLTEVNSDRYKKALNLAYRRCEYLTQLFSKTFYMGTSVMPQQSRKHVWAIYAWCRRTDDLVDSPRACLLNRENLNNELILWNSRLENIFNNRPYDLFDFAMVDTVQKYPDMSIEPFRDMIKGNLYCY